MRARSKAKAVRCSAAAQAKAGDLPWWAAENTVENVAFGSRRSVWAICSFKMAWRDTIHAAIMSCSHLVSIRRSSSNMGVMKKNLFSNGLRQTCNDEDMAGLRMKTQWRIASSIDVAASAKWHLPKMKRRKASRGVKSVSVMKMAAKKMAKPWLTEALTSISIINASTSFAVVGLNAGSLRDGAPSAVRR